MSRSSRAFYYVLVAMWGMNIGWRIDGYKGIVPTWVAVLFLVVPIAILIADDRK